MSAALLVSVRITYRSVSYSSVDILHCVACCHVIFTVASRGEKLSQEQTAALNARHPEATLSCFIALKGGLSTGGWYIVGICEGGGSYCWFSWSRTRSDEALFSPTYMCSGIFIIWGKSEANLCSDVSTRSAVRQKLLKHSCCFLNCQCKDSGLVWCDKDMSNIFHQQSWGPLSNFLQMSLLKWTS